MMIGKWWHERETRKRVGRTQEAEKRDLRQKKQGIRRDSNGEEGIRMKQTRQETV